MRPLAFVGMLLAFAGAHAAEGDVSQAIENDKLGTVHLVVPNGWGAIRCSSSRFSTALCGPSSLNKSVSFQMIFNLNGMEALTDENLERYMDRDISRLSPVVEGRPTAVRFGAKKDGVYVRFTTNVPNQWRYFTKGVRLLERDVLLFTLYSNDRDDSDVTKVLEMVESVRIER